MHPHSFGCLRSIIAVLWFKVFGWSPKYTSPGGISASNTLHNARVRTSGRLDGGDPVGFGESEGRHRDDE